MTTASPIPAAEVAPRMADPPDTEAQALTEQAPARAKASTARPRLRDQAAENPLLTLFGTIIVALLVFVLGTTNLRFDDVHARIDETNLRIDRLEDKVDRLENRIIAIDLKLTALIAHLNATAEVDDALEGRLVTPGADISDSQAPQS